MTNKNRPHHHGDLRNALIDAGVNLVNEHGVAALSIRKVAAKAGVSHAAPAHHFATLKDLRTAVVTRGHKMFAHMMLIEIEKKNATDPHETILAAASGYMNFAFENPSLFHLMFGGSEKSNENPEFQQASQASYKVLQDICAPLAIGKAGQAGNEILVWSMIHGFAGIMLNSSADKDDDFNPKELFKLIAPKFPLKSD